MNRTKRIKAILDNFFSDFVINIVDNSYLHKGHNSFSGEGETHLLVILKRKTQSKLNRLDIHRNINSLLKKEFDMGLHSLQIKIS